PVLVEAPHAEVDVTAARVCVAALDQSLNQFDDLPARLPCQRLAVRAPGGGPVRVRAVVLGHLAGKLLGRYTLLAGRDVDLVVYVGDVLHERHVVALAAQKPPEEG